MKRILWLAVAFIIVAQAFSFAAIMISHQTGAIKITDPKGNVIIVKAGESAPLIADGSTLAVISGAVNIVVTASSKIIFVVGKNKINLSSKVAFKVGVSAKGSVRISVLSGNLSVIKFDGSIVPLSAGDTLVLTQNLSTKSSQINDDTIGAEGYTPPPLNNLGQININVKTEESARDISPIK